MVLGWRLHDQGTVWRQLIIVLDLHRSLLAICPLQTLFCVCSQLFYTNGDTGFCYPTAPFRAEGGDVRAASTDA